MSSSTHKSFVERFRAIAGERIAKVVASLAAGDEDEARREIHGLKGEARVVGFEPIAEIAHELETRLAEGAPRATIDEGIALIEQALPLEPHVAPPGMDAFLARAPEAIHPPVPATVDGPSAEPLAWVASRAAESFLRVDMGALAKLTRSVSEVRAAERDLLALIDTLADPDREPRERARQALGLARQLVFEHRQRCDLLTDDLRRLRTVPLGQLFEPFPRAIAQLGAQLGKAVEVVIHGADVEVDRQVLDIVTDPLLHLVRNAVDHGIEPPDERRARGKPEVGLLRLQARVASGTVEIEIEDDGAGVDVEAVLGDTGGEVEREQALLDALCQHGFSTRADVSDVSGRGVGLDVVKRRVESVGGRLHLRTRRGIGTCFSLELPTTMVLGAMVCVEVEDARYALAPHEVVKVVDAREIGDERAGGGPIVRIDGRAVPLFDLATLTERASASIRRARIVVVRQGEREIAVGVDRFTGTRAVSEQRLDPFLEGIALIRSVAVLADGELAVALDAAELIRRADAFLGDAPRPSRAPEPPRARSHRVLVVDDSELTRDLVVATLREMGVEVLEAVNGERALAQLEAEEVGLIVTDLDMPVVDGFELIRRVRLSPRQRIPIVVLSTRGDPADVRRASELGADAYLIKSRLELEHLRRVVRRYIEASS